MTWSRPTIRPGRAVRSAEWEAILDAMDLVANPPSAQLRQTGAQSFTTGAFAAVTFDAEDWDNYGGHSTVTNTSRYTCKVPGLYVVSGKLSWAANATGRRASKVMKNGADISGNQMAIIATSTNDVEHPVATIQVRLVIDDYVEIYGYQESGGNLSTFVAGVAQHPLMSILRIGD
jgi:hypothetical protein